MERSPNNRCKYLMFNVWRRPKKPGIYKKLCIYSYTFKLQSPFKYSPFEPINQTRLSNAQNSFWTHLFWCLLVLLLFFCSTYSTLAKCFPLRTFFIQGVQKKLLRRDQVNTEGGAEWEDHAIFSSKSAECAALCEQVQLVNHPS